MVDDAICRFAPDDALREIWQVVSAANKHLAATAPWKLAKDPKGGPVVIAILDHTVLALSAIARALLPLLPTTAKAIAAALAEPARPTPILFPKEPLLRSVESHHHRKSG